MKYWALFVIIWMLSCMAWADSVQKTDLQAILNSDMQVNLQKSDIESISSLKNALKKEKNIHFGVYKTSQSTQSFLWITYSTEGSNSGILLIVNNKMRVVYSNSQAGKFKEMHITEYFGKKIHALDLTFQRENKVVSDVFTDLLGNGLNHVYSYIKESNLLPGGDHPVEFNELFVLCPQCIIKCTTRLEHSSTKPELVHVFSTTEINMGEISDEKKKKLIKNVLSNVFGMSDGSLSKTALKEQIELSGEIPNLFMAYGVSYPEEPASDTLSKGCLGGFIPEDAKTLK